MPSFSIIRLRWTLMVFSTLLVEPSRHHMRKHFAFARCQVADLRLHRFHLGMKPVRLGVPGFRTGYGFEQILVLYGLGQEGDRAGFRRWEYRLYR